MKKLKLIEEDTIRIEDIDLSKHIVLRRTENTVLKLRHYGNGLVWSNIVDGICKPNSYRSIKEAITFFEDEIEIYQV